MNNCCLDNVTMEFWHQGTLDRKWVGCIDHASLYLKGISLWVGDNSITIWF